MSNYQTTRRPRKRREYTSTNEEIDIYNSSMIGKFFRRALLSLIILLTLLIGTKTSIGVSMIQAKQLISHHFNAYNSIKWYESKFGSFFPKENDFDSLEVVSTPLSMNNTIEFGDGIIVKIDSFNPVQSYNDGIVVFKGHKKGFGNTLIILSADGKEYWYGYMDEINVSLYSHINENQIIGFAQINELNNDYADLYLAINDGNDFLNVFEASGYAKS